MKRRRLGRTGLEVSEIGFDCGPTAGLMIQGSEQERRSAVACALEHGINYFDTAPGYGDSLSEKNLGETLRALSAQPIVATKVGLSADALENISGAVIRSVEASLARLRLPRISLIQLHNRVGPQRAAKADFGTGALLTVDDVLGPDGVVAAFKSLRARGLVDSFGCSAYGGDMKSVGQLIDSGAFDPAHFQWLANLIFGELYIVQARVQFFAAMRFRGSLWRQLGPSPERIGEENLRQQKARCAQGRPAPQEIPDIAGPVD